MIKTSRRDWIAGAMARHGAAGGTLGGGAGLSAAAR